MIFGLDTETNKNYNQKGSTRCIQVYSPVKNHVVVYHRTDEMTESSNIWNIAIWTPDEKVIRLESVESTDKIMAFLSSHSFITHSGGFESWVLYRDFNVKLKLAGDSYLAGIIAPTPPNQLNNLDALGKVFIGPEYNKFATGSWEDYDWSKSLPDDAIRYAARDAWGCYLIEAALKIQYIKYLIPAYDLELELTPIIGRMKALGLRVEKKLFPGRVKLLQDQYKQALASFHIFAGQKINPNSHKEVAAWLFGYLGIEPEVLTKTGKPSVSKDTLQNISHPAIFELFKIREIGEVLKGVKNLLDSDHEEDSDFLIFHPDYSTVSWNQDSMIKTKSPAAASWPLKFREIVKPSTGKQFYCFDIKALDWAVLVFYAQEKELIKQYLSGVDVCQAFAGELSMTGGEEKAVVSGILNGFGEVTVAQKSGASIFKSAALVKFYLEKFPGIKALQDMIISHLQMTGFALSPLGRKKVVSPYGKKGKTRPADERTALNYYGQTGGADYLKKIIIRLESSLPSDCELCFTGSDTVLIEVPETAQKDQLDQLVSKVLTFDNGIKFLFHSELCKTWGEFKK